MKKFLVLTIIICILLGTLGALSGCSAIAKIQGKTYVTYVNSKDYTVGELETDQDFEDILINWYGGSVNIYEYDGDKLIFKETTNKDVTEAWQMRWAFWDAKDYGKYYQIQYSAKGMWKFGDLKKDLTILVPNKYEVLNKLSITCRGECDINIYMPSISYKGDAVSGSPNVHLDAEWGNINAVFNDIDSFRMIGDADKIENQYYRRLHANNVGNIDYVTSFTKAIFELKNITGYADIKKFSGDIYLFVEEDINSLKLNDDIGNAFIVARNFKKLDLKAKTGVMGIEMHPKQKFVVTMSNYTDYGENMAYKEPHFAGRIGYVPDDELGPDDPDDLYDVTHTGDTWRVRDGKDKYGRDVEVKVSTGSDVYFGSYQSLTTMFIEKGVYNENMPQDPEPYNENNNQ